MKPQQIFVIIAFLVFTCAITIVNIQETFGEIIVGYGIILMLACDSLTEPLTAVTHEKRSTK